MLILKEKIYYNKELELLIGGIDAFNEIHVFLADSSSKEAMEAWIVRLKELQLIANNK